MIVVLTETGNTARLVAKFRPRQPILVLTASNRAARISEGLYRGCKILHLTTSDRVVFWRKLKTFSKKQTCRSRRQVRFALHGTVEGHSGHTNMMKVMRIAEKKTFKRGGEKRARSESGGVIRCTSGVDLSCESRRRLRCDVCFFMRVLSNNETHNNKSNFSIVVSCFSGIDPNLNFEVRYTADVGGRRKRGMYQQTWTCPQGMPVSSILQSVFQ